ncbi:MAG: DUF192 domain-containing protein [Candidatus Cyclonatronum sp.]|uniref:DUF192 domain-containing protein n=1 Tax=Cyclonatronum sp. TaxID=3024185 RepID=UPI0025BDBAEB|nr:DUF192 domain-containing protein [Cyclonatronum sp.]MCC5933057.1 DUF192 domain-containing protein [Balneolales bacterium]MCH8485730.1 DUF192 domain-containing protein [Cyclonatronum sp.]
MRLPAYFVAPAFALLFLLFNACSDDNGGTGEQTGSAAAARVLEYPATVHFKTSHDAQEPSATVRVAVAESNMARQQGLMNVYEMPEDGGMIFIFDQQQPLSFWMANTPLSLDMVFVNDEFEIVRIHQNTTPFSQQQYPSGRPALYVVEVHGGFTARHDIQEGHFIEFIR